MHRRGADAGTGQGREAALLFASAGARAIVAAISAGAGQQTVRRIERRGGRAFFVAGDVGLERDGTRMLETGGKRFGALHILPNGAGVLWRDRNHGAQLGPGPGHPPHGSLRRGEARHPLPDPVRGRPHPPWGFHRGPLRLPRPPQDADASATGGLVSLTRSLAGQFARHNTRGTILRPGTIETPVQAPALRDPRRRSSVESAIPLGRIGRPQEIAAVALFLASDESAYVTGAEIVADGGFAAQ